MGRIFYKGAIYVVSLIIWFITLPVRIIRRQTRQNPVRDTSWEYGRSAMYKKGMVFWENRLQGFGIPIKGSDILEVGSGNGQWLIAASRLGAASVQGVEPNSAIREYSQERLKEFGVFESVKVHSASAESLPFPSNSFDVVLCLGVFMFTRQNQTLGEFCRVLRPNGQLLLTVNGLGYFIMKIKEGISTGRLRRIRYGLGGIFATLLKWTTGHQIGITAVNIAEIKKELTNHAFVLEKVELFLTKDIYPLEHLGFATNYKFNAIKQPDDDS